MSTKQSYTTRVRLQPISHYCINCQSKGKITKGNLVAIATTKEHDVFMLLDVFCSEICCYEWHDKCRNIASQDEYEHTYEIEVL